MKILHVTKKYPDATGGDAIVVQNLEKQQKKNGHKVFILTTNCEEIQNTNNLIKFGLKIKSFQIDQITPGRIISLVILIFRSFHILKKINPHIIHSHSSDLGFCFSFASKFYKIPMVNTCHGLTFNDNQYSFIKRRIELIFLKYSGFKKIITLTKSSIISFKEQHIKNAEYVPNGVNLDDFENKKIPECIRRTNILFVGRLEKQKGLEYLIRAIDILKNNINTFKVILIGDGSQRDYLEKLVVSRNLQGYVNFEGKKNREALIEYYQNADIFILPSIWEGFPLTVLEAWAASLPIIVTNVGSIPEICTDKENAIITEKRNPKALAEAMMLIVRNSKLAKKLGRNGRKLVKEKYGWDKIAKETESIYKEIVKYENINN